MGNLGKDVMLGHQDTDGTLRMGGGLEKMGNQDGDRAMPHMIMLDRLGVDG